MRIGVIDSGFGGLAVAQYLKQFNYDIVLLMDRAYFPYGSKSKAFLCKRSLELVFFLIQKKVDLIVIACNTLSVMALEFLQQNVDFPIFGVFDYLKPFLNPKNIFIGSKNTIEYVHAHYPISVINGSSLISAIEHHQRVEEIIEAIDFHSAEKIILGCTHFLNLKESLFPLPIVHQLQYLKEDIELFEKKKASKLEFT